MKEIFKGYEEIDIHWGEEYDGRSIKGIKKIIELVKDAENIEEMEDILSEKGYNLGFPGTLELLYGILEGHVDVNNITEQYFYRLSEPKLDNWANVYRNSYNYAEDTPENGISVITSNWLHSLKSVFFGISDEDIKSKGIYILKGIIVGKGGDDEPLILATDFAKKTNIKTKKQLIKAVEYCENCLQ